MAIADASAPSLGDRRLAILLAASYAARVPVTAIPLSLLLVVRDAGGAYDVAGLATGAYTLALSVTAPLLGRLADRHGAPRVFLALAPVAAAALVLLGLGAEGASDAALIGLAAVSGAALPPLGALTRGLVSPLLAPARRARVFAIDATAQELCFVAGPLLVAVLAAVTTPARGLVVVGGILVLGAVVFAIGGRGLAARGTARERAPSPLASPGLRVVLGVAVLCGVLFGAMELSITAALDEAGRRERAGMALAVWAIGSLLGGLALVRWPTERPVRRLAGALVATGLLGVAAAAAAALPVTLGGVLFLHGFAQAPLMAVLYVLVPLVVGARISEAFAWLSSAVIGGIAAGSALAGSAVHAAGAPAGFVLAAVAAAAALALVVAVLRPAAARAHA